MTGFGRGRGGKGRGRGNINGRPDNCGMSNLNVNTSVTPTLNQLSLPHSRSVAIHEPIQRTSIDTQLSRNMEESEHPSSMNVNSGGVSSSTTKKRGRGRYKSIQVDMKTKYGGKITVDIPDEIERAVGDGARDIANYCGLIMRTTVSFSDGNWAAISAKHDQAMWLKVKDKFEVGRGRQENMLQAFVVSTTQRLFRAWKTRLHNEYNRYKTDAERRSNMPEDVSPADWEYLIQHFKSSKFQATSARNKLNRAKQIMKHSCGSKSFAEVEESIRDPQTGEKATADKIWELQHTRKKDKGELLWSDPQSQEIHVRIQALVTQQQSEETETPMTGDEILVSVLGERTGYVRGKGYGKRPPRKNRLQQADVEASVSSAMTNMRQQMQAEMEVEMDRKLQEREKIRVEMDKSFQEQIRAEVDKRIQEQMADLMVKMQQGQVS